MERNFNIPISLDWNTDEVIIVIGFFETLEKVYGKGVNRDEILSHYRRFKEIVPSKSEEKQLFKQIDQELGISCFQAIKQARQAEFNTMIKIK